MKPKISVIVLSWNAIHLIKQTIPQLLKLDYPNLEIVVVDNGSTDESIQFLDDIFKNYENCKIIKNSQNLGYSVGKNIGVKNSTGEYIFLLDEDILIQDLSILQKLIEIDNIDKKIISIVNIDKDSEYIEHLGLFYSWYGTKNLNKIPISDLNKYPNLYRISYPHGRIIFMKRDIFINEFEYYDTRQPFNLDDTDLGMFAWISGYECFMFNTNTPIIHLGINNASNIDKYTWRFSKYLSGYCTGIIKNSLFKNIIIHIPILFFGIFLKSVKQSIRYKSPRILFSYFKSVYSLFLMLPYTLKLRKARQLKRKVNEDMFYKIKPINI